MKHTEPTKRSGDIKAWITIAVIDAVATAAVCGLYFWLSTSTS